MNQQVYAERILGRGVDQSEIRFEQLDGLRGIAAFVVFLFHAILMMPADARVLPILNNPFIRPLWDGPGAVMLFFVLSGFVLTLPYASRSPRPMEAIPFLIRRIARLYPAYWAVVAFALVLRIFVFNPEGMAGLSAWANLHWSQPVTWTSIVSHVFMISPHVQVDDIDPVIWSLIIEMKISLVFPLVILLVTRTTRVIYGLLAMFAAIAFTTPLHFVVHSGSSWARAAIMLPAFLLGSYLARYRDDLVSWLTRSLWIRVAVGFAGIALYSVVWRMPIERQSLARWGCALGSGAFILLFLSSPHLEKFGTVRPIRFLGRVSYSFYLVHLPILITIASVLFTRVHSLAAVIAVSLILSLLVAWSIYVCVEIPSHRWGKKIAFLVSAGRAKAAESVAG